MTSAQRHIESITRDIPTRFLKPEVEYNFRKDVIRFIKAWAFRHQLTINPEEELDLYIKSKESATQVGVNHV